MNSKPIKECVKEYFNSCPYLSILNKGEEKGWDIDPIDKPIILGSNVLGNLTHRSFEFMIVTSVFNPKEDLENVENMNLFENITEWIYQNIKSGNKPSLNDNEEVMSMSVEAGGYTFNDDNTEGVYQITCNMLYDKKESE